MPKKNKADEQDFESLLKELTQLVDSVEKGGLSLDESLAKFEQGLALIDRCQKKLQGAEQKVLQWVQKENKEVLVPFKLEVPATTGRED